MASLMLEFAMLPGHNLAEAISRLSDEGIHQLPSTQVVAMRGKVPTYVVTVLEPEGGLELALRPLQKIIEVKGIFSAPVIAPL